MEELTVAMLTKPTMVWRTYAPVIDIPGIELIKMTQKQLDRINKRAADETLGNITPVPAGKIDYSLIPERKD